jgi:hypothetical protein
MVNTFRKNRKKNFSNLSIVLKYLTIVSFTFCLNVLYAQDVILLYKDIIPESISSNPVLRTSINLALTERGKIHPELIYFNIEQLKNLYNKNMNQEEINNYTYLKQRYYLSKRNIFLNHQITKLNESAINQTVQRKCESYLSELIEDPYDSQDAIVDIYEVEHNLIDYIVYQYITRDTSLFYDSSKDYHLLRMEAQHLILKNFQDNYFLPNNQSDNYSESEIEQMLQNWYLFVDSNIEVAEKIQLYQMIEKIIEITYTTAQRPIYSINVGYSPYNYTFTQTKVFPVTFSRIFPSYSEQPASYSGPSVELKASLPQLVGAVGYKIYIKDYIDYLSYINIQLIVSISRGQSTAGENTINNYSSSIDNFYVFTKEIINWENTLKNINSYNAKISVPVFVIGNSLFFELSLNAGLLHYSSLINYDYRLDKREGYSLQYSQVIAAVSGSGEIEVSDNHFNLYPTVDINFETGLGVNLVASGSYNYWALYCGYSF